MQPIPAGRSDALVLFGMTGSLAHKKLFPALYGMAKRGGLEVPVIGVAASKLDQAQVHERAIRSIDEHGGIDDAEALRRMLSRLGYVSGNYNDPATFAAVHAGLLGPERTPPLGGGERRPHGAKRRRDVDLLPDRRHVGPPGLR